MKSFRVALPAIVFTLLALTACGGPSAPSPAPSDSASPEPASPTPTPTPTDGEVDAEAAAVVVTASSLQVFDTDGVAIFGTVYLDDPASLVAQLGSLIGAPTVTSTTGTNSGCDSDQTMYDFGGLLIRTPGFIGATGDWEAEITAAVTGSGLPISTIGGMQVGASRAAFEAAIGDEVLTGDYPDSQYFGFDILNPADPEFDYVGSLARFDGGVLAQLNMPHLIYADC